MHYEIVSPQEGKVTLNLTWAEAEIVARAVGLINSGNLRTHSPDLSDWVDAMTAVIGRNVTNEANRYLVKMSQQQAYLTDFDAN